MKLRYHLEHHQDKSCDISGTGESIAAGGADTVLDHLVDKVGGKPPDHVRILLADALVDHAA